MSGLIVTTRDIGGCFRTRGGEIAVITAFAEYGTKYPVFCLVTDSDGEGGWVKNTVTRDGTTFIGEAYGAYDIVERIQKDVALAELALIGVVPPPIITEA